MGRSFLVRAAPAQEARARRGVEEASPVQFVIAAPCPFLHLKR
jgi:hypothetical protein